MNKKRVLTFLVGLNIVALGIALLVSSNLGQSAWDGVNVGLRLRLGISVGQATMVCAALILSICFALSKDPKVFLSAITSIIQGTLVDFYLNLLSRNQLTGNFALQLCYYLLGILLMAIGCAVYIRTELPTNHVDCMMVTISKRFNKSIAISKIITDGSAILLTVVLTGTLKLGTIPIVLLLGILIQKIMIIIDKYSSHLSENNMIDKKLRM